MILTLFKLAIATAASSPWARRQSAVYPALRGIDHHWLPRAHTSIESSRSHGSSWVGERIAVQHFDSGEGVTRGRDLVATLDRLFYCPHSEGRELRASSRESD
ncbi:hypothetical protein BGW80DRAFT_1316148, partial [Lactifluus volemus]